MTATLRDQDREVDAMKSTLATFWAKVARMFAPSPECANCGADASDGIRTPTARFCTDECAFEWQAMSGP